MKYVLLTLVTLFVLSLSNYSALEAHDERVRDVPDLDLGLRKLELGDPDAGTPNDEIMCIAPGTNCGV